MKKLHLFIGNAEESGLRTGDKEVQDMHRNVILDLEFCSIKKKNSKGLQFINNEVIQFGAVMLADSMQVMDEIVCFVKPKYTTVTKNVTSLTGITTEDLEGAPDFKQVLEQFLCWLGEDIENTYIYSWSDVDEQQIKNEAREKGIIDSRLDIMFDHWNDFQKEFGTKIGYSGQQISLVNALASVDFNFEGKQHDALNDSRNTARLFALCADKEQFEKRTEALRSCFIKDEKSRVTIGDLFAGVLQQAMTF